MRRIWTKATEQQFGVEQTIISDHVAALTIRKHTGLPVLQDLVKLLSKLLVAWVTKQVILAASGVEMLKNKYKFELKKSQTNSACSQWFP